MIRASTLTAALRNNLDPKCKRHHQLKTQHGFDTITDAEGNTWWVTPHGTKYLIEPHDHRAAKQSPEAQTTLEGQALATRRALRMAAAMDKAARSVASDPG